LQRRGGRHQALPSLQEKGGGVGMQAKVFPSGCVSPLPRPDLPLQTKSVRLPPPPGRPLWRTHTWK
jgi:hypothetical protein